MDSKKIITNKEYIQTFWWQFCKECSGKGLLKPGLLILRLLIALDLGQVGKKVKKNYSFLLMYSIKWSIYFTFPTHGIWVICIFLSQSVKFCFQVLNPNHFFFLNNNYVNLSWSNFFFHLKHKDKYKKKLSHT